MTGQLQRIVVGVDGSENSRRALEWAIDLGSQFSAMVIAVHAVGLLSRVDKGPAVPSHSHLSEVHRLFSEDWCQPLTASGLEQKLLCLDGPPAPVLLGAADDESADLIVVGSRGVGGFAELLLGSTSHHVVEHSTRPVLVIPPSHPN